MKFFLICFPFVLIIKIMQSLPTEQQTGAMAAYEQVQKGP